MVIEGILKIKNVVRNIFIVCLEFLDEWRLERYFGTIPSSLFTFKNFDPVFSTLGMELRKPSCLLCSMR